MFISLLEYNRNITEKYQRNIREKADVSMSDLFRGLCRGEDLSDEKFLWASILKDQKEDLVHYLDAEFII